MAAELRWCDNSSAMAAAAVVAVAVVVADRQKLGLPAKANDALPRVLKLHSHHGGQSGHLLRRRYVHCSWRELLAATCSRACYCELKCRECAWLLVHDVLFFMGHATNQPHTCLMIMTPCTMHTNPEGSWCPGWQARRERQEPNRRCNIRSIVETFSG